MPLSSAMALDDTNLNVVVLNQQLADTFNEFNKTKAKHLMSYQLDPDGTDRENFIR